MAASIVVTCGNHFLEGPNRIIIDWISHTDGTVSLDIASALATADLAAMGTVGCAPKKLKGTITKVETAPGLR